MADQTVSELLEEFGIASLRRSPAYTLSGGERRRLEIARAHVMRTAFILLDEPFGQLDVAGVELLTELVKKFQDDGATVLIATHLHQLGKSLCDMHFDMAGGHLRQVGEVAA